MRVAPSNRTHSLTHPTKQNQKKKRGETHYRRSLLPSSDPAFGAARACSLPARHKSSSFTARRKLASAKPRRRARSCYTRCGQPRLISVDGPEPDAPRPSSRHNHRGTLTSPIPAGPHRRSSGCLSSPRSFGPRTEMAPSPSPKNTHTATGSPRCRRPNRNGKMPGCEKRWSRRKCRNCCGDVCTR